MIEKLKEIWCWFEFDTGSYTMTHAAEYYLTMVLCRLNWRTLNRGSTVHCFYLYSWDRVRLRVLWYCSHKWAYYTSPWWQMRELSSWWNDKRKGKTKALREKPSSIVIKIQYYIFSSILLKNPQPLILTPFSTYQCLP